MKYNIREGILRRELCGETLLIATGDAKDACPFIKQLNDTAAYYWHLLEQGMDSAEMAAGAAKEYQLSEETILPGLRDFLKDLEEKNYIIAEG